MGKGLYTNSELVDTLLQDLNLLPRHLIDNQFVAFCNTVGRMGQKLANLRKSIDEELKHKDEQIEDLKRCLAAAGIETHEIPASEIEFIKEKDGAGDGE
jgi:hypothetical protein